MYENCFDKVDGKSICKRCKGDCSKDHNHHDGGFQSWCFDGGEIDSKETFPRSKRVAMMVPENMVESVLKQFPELDDAIGWR